MDNFIEIIGINNDKVLVNVNQIMWVIEAVDTEKYRKCTELSLVTGTLRTYESYEEIKKRIFNLGKVYIR